MFLATCLQLHPLSELGCTAMRLDAPAARLHGPDLGGAAVVFVSVTARSEINWNRFPQLDYSIEQRMDSRI